MKSAESYQLTDYHKWLTISYHYMMNGFQFL